MLDLKCDLLENYNCQISQEALHKKFTPEAVRFLQGLLSKQIQNQLSYNEIETFDTFGFTAINIKDSSKFKLPKDFINVFSGYGGFIKEASLMNIQ